ncbi:hypothetical protein ANN_13256 [Periplaneta americana]|uniref:Uncharacterized protein n=1 Tax=Periplaneta americana TaxID=6978 RepID=A0ABQ8TIW6_PERAM|nr:hypothetical protein ANN_13256 [Periplaneta americana]
MYDDLRLKLISIRPNIEQLCRLIHLINFAYENMLQIIELFRITFQHKVHFGTHICLNVHPLVPLNTKHLVPWNMFQDTRYYRFLFFFYFKIMSRMRKLIMRGYYLRQICAATDVAQTVARLLTLRLQSGVSSSSALADYLVQFSSEVFSNCKAMCRQTSVVEGDTKQCFRFSIFNPKTYDYLVVTVADNVRLAQASPLSYAKGCSVAKIAPKPLYCPIFTDIPSLCIVDCHIWKLSSFNHNITSQSESEKIVNSQLNITKIWKQEQKCGLHSKMSKYLQRKFPKSYKIRMQEERRVHSSNTQENRAFLVEVHNNPPMPSTVTVQSNHQLRMVVYTFPELADMVMSRKRKKNSPHVPTTVSKQKSPSPHNVLDFISAFETMGLFVPGALMEARVDIHSQLMITRLRLRTQSNQYEV